MSKKIDIKELPTDIDPQCINGTKALAINNRGELMPCCEWDTGPMLRDPYVQKLLAVSKLSDNDDINEIILSDEWQQFYNDLVTGDYIPIMCRAVCGKGRKTRITKYRERRSD